jgi:glycine betaine/choline ABC-type transport system substrate-binding protein
MDLRKLDALVAEKIMGWTEIKESKAYHTGDIQLTGYNPKDLPSPYTGNRPTWTVPHYSSDIKAAWEVVSKLEEKFNLIRVDRNKMKNLWTVIVSDELMENTTIAYGETASHCICLAALKSMNVDVSEWEK